ncbi:MAG: DUF3108 domain-containing protein [candidate division WOR-3 bacterium]
MLIFLLPILLAKTALRSQISSLHIPRSIKGLKGLTALFYNEHGFALMRKIFFIFYLPLLMSASSSKTFLMPGEKLMFEAHYGFINLGTLILEITDTATIAGKKCYLLSSFLNSHPDMRFIFSINDTLNTMTTVDGLLPVSYEKRIHEGKYSAHQKFQFCQESLYVLTAGSKINITHPVRDLLSFWYYLRLVPLVLKDTLILWIFERNEAHRIECLIQKKEVIKTPLGKFSTIRVTPRTAGKGIFGAGGSMDIWYTDDQNRLPVQIRTKLKFGTVNFKLKEVRN